MNAMIDISMVQLETKDLIMRPFHDSDLMDFFTYAKVPGVGEAAGWKHHESIEESQKVLEIFIRERKTFALVEKTTQKVIGSIGIEYYKEDLLPELSIFMGREIGCVLAKEYWGHGLMTSAVSKVIEYLFTEVNLDFIVYTYFQDNVRSKRVCEKNQFHFVKSFLSQTSLNQNIHSNLYLLFKEEWEK